MAETSVFCITCDRSPKWANHPQCFGCLFDHVKPCDVVPKLATHPDLAVALAEIRRYRAQWEQAHPLWELVPDYQRIWPESAAPSRHADYATTIGRKLVHARWKVERRHPRGSHDPAPFLSVFPCSQEEWRHISYRVHGPAWAPGLAVLGGRHHADQ